MGQTHLNVYLKNPKAKLTAYFDFDPRKQAGDWGGPTGNLGGSQGGRHLSFEPRLNEAREIRRLIPNGVHACIDITDGLSRDLQHLCGLCDVDAHAQVALLALHRLEQTSSGRLCMRRRKHRLSIGRNGAEGSRGVSFHSWPLDRDPPLDREGSRRS